MSVHSRLARNLTLPIIPKIKNPHYIIDCLLTDIMIALGSAGTSVQELWQVCLQNFDVEPDRANNMFGGIRPQQLV